MSNSDIEESIKQYLLNLKTLYGEIKSIWLIGSRANNAATDNSDWDFLLFGSKNVFRALQNDQSFKREKIDLLVVDEDGEFKDPWQNKNGDLASWRWKKQSENTATYRSTKFIPDEPEGDLGTFEEKWFKAIRIL